MSTSNGTPSNGVRQRLTSPRLTFTVTTDMIEESKARHSGHCMIAETIKQTYPHLRGVTADLATIRASDPEKRLRYIYLTPRNAQLALIEFDRGIVPEPFTVTLWRAAQITRNAQWDRTRGGGINSPSPRPTPRPTAQSPKLPSLGPKRTQREGGGSGSIPTVIGGAPPPMGLLLGRAIGDAHGDNGAYYDPTNKARRRAFGIRMLRY